MQRDATRYLFAQRHCHRTIVVSQKTDKKIPLDAYTEQPHDCQVWKQQRKRRCYYPCRNCSADIYFDNAQKSKNGKWVPIDKQTGTPHQCPLAAEYYSTYC